MPSFVFGFRDGWTRYSDVSKRFLTVSIVCKLLHDIIISARLIKIE